MQFALSLRVMEVTDISNEYLEALNTKRITEFTDLRHRTTDYGDAQDFITAMRRSPCDVLWGIFVDADDLIGTVRLGPIEFPNQVSEIGILIFSERWHGLGIGRAVISTVCSEAGKNLGLVKFTAGVLLDNKPSARAFEAAGFELEGCQSSQEVLLDGQRTDVLLFGLALPSTESLVNNNSDRLRIEWPPMSKWSLDLPHYQARLH